MVLNELMPVWHRRERHRLSMDLPAWAVLHAAENAVWGDVPVFRAMMAAVALGRRPFPADQRIIDLFLSSGFAMLYRDGEELVVGGVERISRKQPVVPLDGDVAERFRSFAEPAHLKLAFNFRYRDGVLSTETRVFGTDKRARRLFAAYWLVIRAGSGFIRRIWLRGVRRHARRVAAGPPIDPAPGDAGR
ncbi:hypothetical protein HC031_13185 [Planosporangium thailandense]|uniref:DUF2867 domain-containing protein n=1 Tax=Planosporangium thailandense TaxID=765197 RepID=A0ABX0XZI9_9ACTN|nr:hypothetical protein [Planosporangium thailandense]NJC70659.1 hypothetical protein [Planosporangium thailandense]